MASLGVFAARMIRITSSILSDAIGQLISEGKFFLEALEKAEKITN